MLRCVATPLVLVAVSMSFPASGGAQQQPPEQHAVQSSVSGAAQSGPVQGAPVQGGSLQSSPKSAQQPHAPGQPNPAQAALNGAHRAEIAQARAAADGWLKLIDTGKYDDSWKEAAQAVREQVSKKQWKEEISATRSTYGELVSRAQQDANYATTLPGAPDGQYVIFEFNSSFAHKSSTIETLVLQRQDDGSWRVAGYFLR